MPEAIESALAQTYHPVEVIVVNDGSTDNSGDVAESFQPHILVLHQRNKGPGSARNTGIARSREEWLVFLDADDLMAPELLETRIRELKETAAEVVFGDAHLPHGDHILSRETESAVLYEPGLEASLSLLEKSGFPIHTAVISRSAVLRAGPFNKRRFAEDYAFWLRCFAQAPKVYKSDKILAIYRRHPEQATQNDLALYWNIHMVAVNFWRRHRKEFGDTKTPLYASIDKGWSLLEEALATNTLIAGKMGLSAMLLWRFRDVNRLRLLTFLVACVSPKSMRIRMGWFEFDPVRWWRRQPR